MLVASLLFITIAIISGTNMDYNLQRTRNQYLRFYVATKKSHTKRFICEIWSNIEIRESINNLAIKTKERTNKIYNSVLSKYHDAHIAYYSLPEEDRELIEQIINLHF